MLGYPHDRECAVLVRAAYHGDATDPEPLRQALLAPQMGVLSVDVDGTIFSITCRTKDAAENVLRVLPFLSMTVEMFLVTEGRHAW